MNTDCSASAFDNGILLVDAQGVIESVNADAETMLSITKDQTIGHSVIDVLAGQVSDAVLMELIDKFKYEPTNAACQKSAQVNGWLSVRCDTLLDSSHDLTWLITLTRPNHRFLSLSRYARRCFDVSPLMKRSFATVAVLFVAIPIYRLLPEGLRMGEPQPIAESNSLMQVASGGVTGPQMTETRLSVVGTIEAGNSISVTAPFDATIKERTFSFDTGVEQGQVLLRLDTTELLSRVQDAKVVMLKAAKTLREMETWEKGTEVARAQRGSIFARQQVEQTERKVQEADALLKKGIISRSEYDGLVEQLGGQRSQLGAALDDLKATREKANQSNLEIARIEYSQAQTKYHALSGGLILERITAPVAGVITKASAASGLAPATLEVGSRITKGQLLFNIASTDKLMVSAKVDEADIVDLAVGARVAISIDSQDMPAIEGRLSEISAQATQNGGATRSADFDIRIAIPTLDEEQRRRLRVGMSCNVSIEKNGRRVAAAPLANGNPIR